MTLLERIAATRAAVESLIEATHGVSGEHLFQLDALKRKVAELEAALDVERLDHEETRRLLAVSVAERQALRSTIARLGGE
jgi:hypothetical protein